MVPAHHPKLVMIDNYDSFTYNLVYAFQRLGARVEVFRNDRASLKQIGSASPEAIVISPGPGRPRDAGITLDVIDRLHSRLPILGICLGHQAIAEYFGGHVVRAASPVHGKACQVKHDRRTIFSTVPLPFRAARYHSLVVSHTRFPANLEITASTEDGTIMALRHRLLPVEGVQFHPESFMTPEGPRLLRNFLHLAARR